MTSPRSRGRPPKGKIRKTLHLAPLTIEWLSLMSNGGDAVDNLVAHLYCKAEYKPPLKR